MKVGILSLQGDVREHENILIKLGAEPVRVKVPQDLDKVDALILPGGESTTMGMLMSKYKLDKTIKEKHKDGMPIYGTCAGAILLAKTILDSKQTGLGIADLSIKRNDYGRQIDSFETELDIKEIGKFKGVFIRSPKIKNLFNGAEVMSEYKNNPVMVKQHNLLLSTFHPELTNDSRVHKYFIDMAKEYNHVRNIQRDIEDIK